jgi:hypothetical protein
LTTIKTVAEIAVQRFDECVEQATNKFLPAVRVCYGVDKRDKPDAFGTCFLLRVQGRQFLVTAAHVIDENKHTSIYVAGRENLVLLESSFLATNLVDGSRLKDHYDFAFTELNAQQCIDLGVEDSIDISAASGNQAPPDKRVYLALGFPASKQKALWETKNTLLTVPLKFWNTGTERPDLCEQLKISADTHLFIGYAKHVKSVDGTTQTAVKPQGASGGILVDLGQIDIDKLTPESPCTGLLAGVLIEHHKDHKAIIAVKIQLVLEQIRVYVESNPR